MLKDNPDYGSDTSIPYCTNTRTHPKAGVSCGRDKPVVVAHHREREILLQIQNAPKHTEDYFRIIAQARSYFHLGVFESVYIRTQKPALCKQKEFVFHLDSSNKQW